MKTSNAGSPLRPVKARVKNSLRPPAMIYADIFILLLSGFRKVDMHDEDFTKVLFEMPALCYSGNTRCQLSNYNYPCEWQR